MPELPEAETIVRGIRPALEGRTIHRAHVVKADVLRESSRSFRARVANCRIDGVTRRGKNVVIELNERTRLLVINLGMTGRVLPIDAKRPTVASTHPAIWFDIEPHGIFVFDDVRRFGTVELLSTEAWEVRQEAMGPEPLSPRYHAREMLAALHRSRAPVRSWLLDQHRIAGVGNIYAAEALFRAGLHPQRPSNAITSAEANRLHRSVRAVLSEAIMNRGTTLRNYRDASNEAGNNGPLLKVYGREGKPCLRCNTQVQRIVFAGRSAFLCPSCQS